MWPGGKAQASCPWAIAHVEGVEKTASPGAGPPSSCTVVTKRAVEANHPSRHHEAESGLSSQFLSGDIRSTPRWRVESAARVNVGPRPSPGAVFTEEKGTIGISATPVRGFRH